MPLSNYLKIYPCHDRPGYHLVYSTRKGSVVRLSEAMLAAALAETLTADERATLTRLEIVVDDASTEREAMKSLVKRATARKNRFRGIVVLNLDCNLACPYCFEDEFRGRHYMSHETGRLLVEMVIRDHVERGRDVQLDFYGGEPLLSVPLLKEIAAPLRLAATEAGTKFSFFLITNGTLLTRQLVEELLPLGLAGASLTVDGPPEIHNRQRPFVSGAGSFDTILKNIKALCDLLPLRVGGNCTPDNYRDFPRLLDIFMAEGITPDRIDMVQFMAVSPKAGKVIANDAAGCTCSSEPWLMEAGPFLRGEILKRGFKADKPTMSACMIEFENDLVVKHDGSLYKCPAFMGWPELCVGTLSEGMRDYSISHNLAVWHNDECLDCPYLPLCFGGCRNMPLMRTGAINEVDCRRAFFDATLETIIRQDMAFKSRKEAASPPV